MNHWIKTIITISCLTIMVYRVITWLNHQDDLSQSTVFLTTWPQFIIRYHTLTTILIHNHHVTIISQASVNALILALIPKEHSSSRTSIQYPNQQSTIHQPSIKHYLIIHQPPFHHPFNSHSTIHQPRFHHPFHSHSTIHQPFHHLFNNHSTIV